MKMKKRIVTAVLAGTVCIGVSQAALVAEWNFDSQTLENSGTSGSVHDGTVITGSFTNATAVAATYSTDTPSGSGYALDLSAGSQYLSITNSSTHDAGYVDTFDAAEDFTISMWVKSTDGTWGKWNEFGGKGHQSTETDLLDQIYAGWSMRAQYFTEGNGTLVNFYHTYYDADEVNDGIDTVAVTDQTWHLLTFTYDETTQWLTLYVDGVAKDIAEGAVLYNASDWPLVFGARDDGTRHDQILCDSIQFYDHALTETEVSALYIEQADFFVDSDALELELYAPATAITGSVAVSYIANASVDVAVSISGESHPGALRLVNATPLTLTAPSPSNTVLQFAFDNAVTGLLNGESATGLVTIAWNVTGDAAVTEVVLPISVLYALPAPTPILWDIGTHTPSTVADFVAAGVSEDTTGATVVNIAGAQSMVSGGVSVDLSGYSGSYVPSATYTGDGGSIMKEYIYQKGYSLITISGLSGRLYPDTEYCLYVWGKGDGLDQTATFTVEGTSITTGTNDVFTSDATNFVAKFSITTDVTVADSIEIGWQAVAAYTAFNGFALLPRLNPNPEIGAISIESVSGGSEVALSFDTTEGYVYGVAATANLTSGPWDNIMTNVPGNGGTVTVTSPVPATAEFYRAYLME